MPAERHRLIIHTRDKESVKTRKNDSSNQAREYALRFDTCIDIDFSRPEIAEIMSMGDIETIKHEIIDMHRGEIASLMRELHNPFPFDPSCWTIEDPIFLEAIKDNSQTIDRAA